jgi:hypothetical protein
VFVQGNAAFGTTSTVGPVAMGGNLTIGSNFTVAAMAGEPCHYARSQTTGPAGNAA